MTESNNVTEKDLEIPKIDDRWEDFKSALVESVDYDPGKLKNIKKTYYRGAIDGVLCASRMFTMFPGVDPHVVLDRLSTEIGEYMNNRDHHERTIELEKEDMINANEI